MDINIEMERYIQGGKMVILRNPFRKINRAYIINSSRQDCYADIEPMAATRI